MISLGITTYERFDRFRECFEYASTNSDNVDEILVVDDSSITQRAEYDQYFGSLVSDKVRVVVSQKNFGPAHSKNIILRHFYDKGSDYIFTLEDDCNILTPLVFEKYIDAHKKTGIHHFNFGDGTPLNRGRRRTKEVNGCQIAIFPHLAGGFTFYTRELIDRIGYYDENFVNAWEHVDYTYRSALAGLTTPFWQFADILGSENYLAMQEGSYENSSLENGGERLLAMKKGLDYWTLKHGEPLFGRLGTFAFNTRVTLHSLELALKKKLEKTGREATIETS